MLSPISRGHFGFSVMRFGPSNVPSQRGASSLPEGHTPPRAGSLQRAIDSRLRGWSRDQSHLSCFPPQGFQKRPGDGASQGAEIRIVRSAMVGVDLDSLHLVFIFDEQFPQWSIAYISEVDKTFDNSFTCRVFGVHKLYRHWPGLGSLPMVFTVLRSSVPFCWMRKGKRRE